MSKIDLLLEAERRGILPENKKQLLEEARRRGLVAGSHQPEGAPDRSDWTPEMKASYEKQSKSRGELEKAGLPPATGTTSRIVQSATLNSADEIMAGMKTGLIDLPASLVNGDERSVRDMFNENWAAEQSDLDETYKNTGGRGFTMADLAGGLITGVPRAAAATAATVAPTYWNSAKTGAKVAVPYGAANRFFASEGGVGERAGEALDPRAAAFDAAIGAGFGALVHGGLNLRERRVAARNEQAARANEVARQAEREGIELPAAAITDSPVIQGVTAGLGDSVMGGPVRRAMDPAIAGVERRVQEEIARGAGGQVPTPQNAGQNIKDELSYLLTERSRPTAEVRDLPDADLSQITGPIGNSGFLPNRQTIAPVSPRYVRDQPIDPYMREPVIPENPPFQVEQPQYPEMDPKLFQPSAEQVGKVTVLRSKLPEIEGRVADLAMKVEARNQQVKSIAERFPNAFRITSEGGVIKVKINQELLDLVNNTPNYERAIDPGAIQARSLRDLIGNRETKKAAARWSREEYQAAEWLRNRAVDGGIDDLAMSLKKARNSLDDHKSILAREEQAIEVERVTAMENARRAAVEAENARVAQINSQREAEARANAETNARDQARREAEVRARQETDRLRQEAAREAEEETRRLQQVADEEYRGARSRAEADGVGQFRPGRSGETYPTDFDAAYTAADRAAPRGNIGNPLGSRDDPPLATNLARLLDSMAVEARGTSAALRGYKEGQIFGPDGRGPLDPRIVAHLRNLVGDEVTERITYLSDLRTRGLASPGNNSLKDIRTAIGRAIGDAQRASRTPGNTRAPDEATLARLYDAFATDRNALLTARGGERAVQMYQQIDPAYRGYIRELRQPLSRVFGDNVNSVDALNRLVESTQNGGNADLLRSYFRVMQEKGNPQVATAYLLRHMTEGGMDGFLRSYRALSPDARRIMFQGNAREMGESLDRLAAIGGRLERFNRGRGQADSWERFLSRATSPTHALIGLAYWVHTPLAITTAAGANVAARVLSSRWYANWLRTAPQHLPAGQREAWTRHALRLGALMQDNLGVSDAEADKVAAAISKGPEAEAPAAKPMAAPKADQGPKRTQPLVRPPLREDFKNVQRTGMRDL